MSINFVKVQISDLREREAKNIVDPAVGKFSAIAVNGPEVAPERFKQLLEYATERELDVFWWYCPGYWNVLDLPAHCNIRSVWSDAPRDWTYFGLEESRNRTVQQAITLLSDFPDIAGILLDYISYPWGIIGQRPDLFTADHITQTVDALYSAMQTSHPGKLLIGNVGTAPAYVRSGQAWPDWMSDGIVDGVNVRCYVLPSDLPEALAGIPNFGSKKQGVCMAPGGTLKIRPLTGAEVGEWLETADEFGFPTVSVFDFTSMEGYWQYIPKLSAAGRGTTELAPTKNEILKFLRGLPHRSERKVLVGQQLSHEGQLLQKSYEDYILGLETATGKAPAILGCSFRRTEPEFTPDDIALMSQLMIEHWNRGGLVSITPFFHSPWGSGANSIDGRPAWGLEALVDPGTPAYGAWHRTLDQFASEVQVLADNGVVFIFRPFHECTGSWFWWGPKPQEEWDSDQARFSTSFIAVWQDMHYYLNVRHGLADHIVWAYTSANRDQERDLSALFPGQQYADLVGCSVYDNDVMLIEPGYDELQSCGVPVFLAECGRSFPNTSEPWSNMTVWEAVRARYPDVTAVHFWSSWDNNAQAIVDNADADRFMNDAWGITLRDVADVIAESAGEDVTVLLKDLRSVEAVLRQKAQELTAEADGVAATIAELERIDSRLNTATEPIQSG